MFNLILLILIFIVIYNLNYVYKYANEIDKNVWLGNRIASQDRYFINKNNIQLIINCTKHLPIIPNINSYRLSVNDDLSIETHNRILTNINDIIDLINLYKKQNKGILIHCHAGKQRAATVAACYLMKSYNYDVNKAITRIKQKRPIAFKPGINYFNTLNTFYNRNNKS